MPSTIHQEMFFPVVPGRVYETIMGSKQFGEATNALAQIGSEAGASFSCFDGKITGRNVDLVQNKRIVQAWRSGNWSEGIYSIVRFELTAHDGGTRLIFDHTGFPVEHFTDLKGGWQKMYWDQLQRYFA